MNNNNISNRFIDAIIEPIIVNQFLVVGGNFMIYVDLSSSIG